MRLMRVIGCDLASREGSDERPANQTALVAVEPNGSVAAAKVTAACGKKQ